MPKDDDSRERLLAFAGQIGGSDVSAEQAARKRGWLDADGKITDDGRTALAEIDGQTGTRSVFR